MKNLKKQYLHKKLFYPVKFYQELPPFASMHNRMYDSNYYRCFSIDYKMYEHSAFNNSWGWYIRFKPFAIPKIRNNILKFIFGKKMYIVRTSYGGESCSHSESLTKKAAKERIEFEQGDGYDRDMYFSHIEYERYLFKSSKEEGSIKSMLNFMLNIHAGPILKAKKKTK